ncbi:hypothetical protein GGI12_002563 [Dipsacomyces acuminosporus]|nr:hypothetical protein GGI12_002563 [Dipsacomyces acuminosporus]
MWPHAEPPKDAPPPPPSSAISEDGESRQSIVGTTTMDSDNALDALLAKGPLDIELLTELLGSLDDTAASTAASTPSTNKKADAEADALMPTRTVIDPAGDIGDLTDLSGITTKAVLDGLRSLDEFERQAAVHTEGRMLEDADGEHMLSAISGKDAAESMLRATASAPNLQNTGASGADSLDLGKSSVNGTDTGFVSLNEAELSAALEQIYWGSLDMPLVGSADLATRSADLGGDAFFLPALTPTSAPLTTAQTPHASALDAPTDTWTAGGDTLRQAQHTNNRNVTDSQNEEMSGDLAAEEDDEEDEENDNAENPLELEELSLFSLFLSDMTAFEGFLDNLSLNQLRQCAATVNSVLVRRESALNAPVRPAKYVAKPSHATSRPGNSQLAERTPSDNDNSVILNPLASADPQFSNSNGHGREESQAMPTGNPEDARASEPRAATAAAEVAAEAPTAEPPKGNSSADPLPSTTLSLLREWLPPSTADCVITALQAANLTIPSGPASKPSSRATSSHAQGHSSNEPSLDTDKDGTPWLSFFYAQKGKPRRHSIRIDIDRAPITVIPITFQNNNCVYPRANCAKSAYTGNRWNYETECNTLGWKLSFLNQELLSGRRGLLQAAVNNYRSMVAGRKSRRITRLEKAERSQQNRPAASGSHQHFGSKPSDNASKRPLSSVTPHRTSLSSISESGICTADGGGTPHGKRTKTHHSAHGIDCSQVSDSGTHTRTIGELARVQSLPRLDAVQGNRTAPSASINSGPGKHPGTSTLAGSASAPATPAVPCASTSPEAAKCLVVNAYINSKFVRIRVYIDFGSIDESAANEQFKRDHAVFARALNAERSRYGNLQGRWEFEMTCNELAWKLAWLNKPRLKGRKPLIQKCLDAYRAKFPVPPWTLLSCYSGAMGSSVTPQFFNFWNPRPGRRRLYGPSSVLQQPDPGLAMEICESDELLLCDENGEGIGIGSAASESASASVSVLASAAASKPAAANPRTTIAQMSAMSNTGNEAAQASATPAGLSTASANRSSSSSSSSNVTVGGFLSGPAPGAGSDSAARVRANQQRTAGGSPRASALSPTAGRLQPTHARNQSPARPIAGAAGTSPANRQTPHQQQQQHQVQQPRQLQLTPQTQRPKTPAQSRPPAAAPGQRPQQFAPRLHPSQRPHPHPQQRQQGMRPRPLMAGAATQSGRLQPHVRSGMRPGTQAPVPQKPATTATAGQQARMPALPTRTQQQSPNHGRTGSGYPPGSRPSAPAFQPAIRALASTAHQRPAAVAGANARPGPAPRPAKPQNSRRQDLVSSGAPAARPRPPMANGAGASTPSCPAARTAQAIARPSNPAASKQPAASSASASSAPAPKASSEKSAKAQQAATVLTDVLRRLAKSDPSLAQLTGVLSKGAGDSPSSTSAASDAVSGNRDEADDDTPLDAKVAELEKLIIDIQKK